MLTTPAEAFLPNNVPCGPRSTSIRSTSPRSSVAWPGRVSTTPSSTVETEGSTPGEVVIVPTPRMKIVRSLFDAPVRKLTEGIAAVIAWTLLSWRSASEAPLSAVIAIGTCWSDSLRKRAVTTTSPSAGLAAGADVGVGVAAAVSCAGVSGACCAVAGSATASPAVVVRNANRRRRYMDSPLCEQCACKSRLRRWGIKKHMRPAHVGFSEAS